MIKNPNYWDKLMGTEESAAVYMQTYGEGIGSETRKTIADFINSDESVLDVGCGPGWNFDHFKEYGPEVKYRGEDYSRLFVKVANDRAADKYDERPFFYGDCRSLHHHPDSFDVVILQDVLEHTNGYEEPVRQALHVAKRRVIIAFWHLTENDDHINEDGDDGFGAWYSRPKWEAFLNSLPYVWFDTESSPEANRHHVFYIIDKEST